MTKKPSIMNFAILIVIIMIGTQACGSAQAPASTSPQASTAMQSAPEGTQALAASTVIAASALETATPAITVTSTPTLSVVTITAANGNLAIRSGPDPSFDAIATLKDGETARVLARSILDGWVQISIPSRAGETGWVSIKTEYSAVNGYVLDLPQIDAVEWPVGSYLINCTPHRMNVQPIDKVIQSTGSSGADSLWLPPGPYTVYDLDVPGQPMAMNLNMPAHSSIHILKDGNRRQWDCPASSN